MTARRTSHSWYRHTAPLDVPNVRVGRVRDIPAVSTAFSRQASMSGSKEW